MTVVLTTECAQGPVSGGTERHPSFPHLRGGVGVGSRIHGVTEPAQLRARTEKSPHEYCSLHKSRDRDLRVTFRWEKTAEQIQPEVSVTALSQTLCRCLKNKKQTGFSTAFGVYLQRKHQQLKLPMTHTSETPGHMAQVVVVGGAKAALQEVSTLTLRHSREKLAWVCRSQGTSKRRQVLAMPVDLHSLYLEHVDAFRCSEAWSQTWALCLTTCGSLGKHLNQFNPQCFICSPTNTGM